MQDKNLLKIGIFTMIAGGLLWVSACHPINKSLGLKDDNVIEESVEAILKQNTGLDIDFTPDSQEVR